MRAGSMANANGALSSRSVASPVDERRPVAEAPLEARAHLVRGLLGECDREQPLGPARLRAVETEQRPEVALDERVRLAGAHTRNGDDR